MSVTMPSVVRARARPLHGFKRLLSPDEPWIWLLYLPLYGLPWFLTGGDGRQPVTTGDLYLSLAALAAFLFLYVRGSMTQGRALIAWSVAVFLLSLAIAPLGGNWTVLTIYAAAMIAKLRPAARSVGLIILFCGIAAGLGILTAQPLVWWLPGLVLAALIGGANISRAALADKNLALEAAQEKVRTLTQVAERERISRDLHDLLGRTLTLIVIKADLAGRLLDHDPDAVRREVAEIAASARENLIEVRQALSGLGMISLPRELAASCEALEAAAVACSIAGASDDVPNNEGTVLAMALREAVTNVIRHAGARACCIGIARNAEMIELTVTDDGRGGPFREGFGLTGMRARLRAAGGELLVHTQGGGTKLAVRLPVTAS